jgi:uncharacterized protein YqhQ
MPDLAIGGQAVIEGVMMRSRDCVATAVRTADGKIAIKTQSYTSLTLRNKVLGLPIIRGAVSFVEMLIIGVSTLNYSADVFAQADETEPSKKKSNTFWLVVSTVLAFGLGILIFFFVPLAISQLLNVQQDAVSFNLIAGGVRLTMFVLYIWGISFVKDLRRVFEYHGAEHKVIYAYEMGDQLTPERAATYTRFHPRCGTSFILIVALVAMLVYAVSDSIYAIIVGHAPALITRFLLHFSLLPLVAGSSYELLKLSGKTRDNAITKILIQPGLWLQRITTKEPSADQLEVSIAALETALGIRKQSQTTPVS